MNFTIYFEAADSGYTAYMFNFVNLKMNWAVEGENGKKQSDPDVMAELLTEAHNSGLPCHVGIAD